ncbi:MAG: hypothetical protein A2622_05990 [Bdellovibrionales bacterium RIFCSPHIGHO2_01_FULL_40_29]|nr:MAG: hypothetical protein A2622_05990 [Bdellovibrionales bacterium RIFCSPHIGHO2_01_FULL_40_29]OFZ35002.1 MAG: hypothetical protein A3D17_06340 [Bdellovibrionales bacterium RIFCSPHIGHO2_02_FULL_40_15]
MNQKLLIKVLVLGFGLAMVITTMKFSNSSHFKEGINQLFAVDSGKNLRWCPDHVVEFQWMSPALPSSVTTRWSAAKARDVQNVFCEVAMEATDGLNLTQIQFTPLLLAQSAEGKTALLEWSPESKVFRVQGMPFKSARLSRELLDDPK